MQSVLTESGNRHRAKFRTESKLLVHMCFTGHNSFGMFRKKFYNYGVVLAIY